MYAAKLTPRAEVIDFLIQSGANVKLKDAAGHNTLYYLNKNEKLTAEEKKRLSDKIFLLMQQ